MMDSFANFNFSSCLRRVILGVRQKETAMQDRDSHGKPIEQLVAAFATHLDQGLGQQEARDRLAKHGANELSEHPRPGFWALL